MKIVLPILTLLLISCSQTDKSKTDEDNSTSTTKLETELPQVNDQFQSFLDKFPKIELPVQIKGCEADYEGLTEFNNENPSPYIQDYSYAVGQIKTNGNYVSVITLGVADCLLPVLTTYKLTGEKIDSKTIAIGYCGDGPCFECDEFMAIKDDFSIYTADTMKTSECDDDYNPIPGTESIEVIFKEGRLTEKGEIELSDEMKKEIK
jgi:hypothetical protein